MNARSAHIKRFYINFHRKLITVNSLNYLRP